MFAGRRSRRTQGGNRTEGAAGRRDQGAVLILGLLVAIALMAIVYAIYMAALTGRPTVLRSRSGPADDRPWLEEDRIVPAGQLIEPPRAGQAQLDGPKRITARVSREGDARGRLTIVLTPRGEVTCGWHAEFAHGKRETVFDATTEGNIDATKVYEGPEGRDETLLYFITKGTYTEQVYDRSTTRGSVSGGTVYVTGWLGPDLRGHGKVTLTTDQRSSVSYEWES